MSILKYLEGGRVGGLDGLTIAGMIEVNMVYAVVFLLEVLLRLVASGFARYFFGSGWSWNWLDVFVVTSAWVELLVNLFAPRCIQFDFACVPSLPRICSA